MPRIFDNLTPATALLPALRNTLARSTRADFCVGYINLRGWGGVAGQIDRWSDGQGPCRVLVGMQRAPEDEVRELLAGRTRRSWGMDNRTAQRVRRRWAASLRDQLTHGAPTNEDEAALKRLARQLRQRLVRVKLHLRHPLHAKLYLLHRDDPDNPVTAFVGSSNLTMAGLSGQGELNVDVLDHDAARKLQRWFDDRWQDQFCVDITDELAEIIDESWAREALIPPYHVYLKMAYHLSREAREGLSEFGIPAVFKGELFDYQAAAVRIAAHHLNRRGGVLIGDVVGLGKTRMATAVARIFEDDLGFETLIICPKNLVSMWRDHAHRYGLRARVMSLARVVGELPKARRYRQIVIDESHNLRNRDGTRYRAIRDYIRDNESRCILLSATPYNKTYLDLSGQLRLFVPADQDLGIRPERYLRSVGEAEFGARHQVGPRTLAAFEKSEFAEDWRDLMGLFLVRRTRTFIRKHYADVDPGTGRPCLVMANGSTKIIPTRVPRTIKFPVNDRDPGDQYGQLYKDGVVNALMGLRLPRYGLGNYVEEGAAKTEEEARDIEVLSRGGKRLIGFCRTNLFKRLESSGSSFIRSLESHVLRNGVVLHALRLKQPLPVGSLGRSMLDAAADAGSGDLELDDDPSGPPRGAPVEWVGDLEDRDRLMARADAAYEVYRSRYRSRFRWVRSELFRPDLAQALEEDTRVLVGMLRRFGRWQSDRDRKLATLHDLLAVRHRGDKVLVFSQFADTVDYLAQELEARGVDGLAAVTGRSADPTRLAQRFSPGSNGGLPDGEGELRVLIATDLLSEGQNLQDCAVVVNYDLPWAIIRIIQRAGRVDRIGQRAPTILCYSFLPADGVERVIALRDRVRQRLTANAEVVGADEAFFEPAVGMDQAKGAAQGVLDLYHEKAGVLDEEDDGDVDLGSHALEIWRSATADDPALKRTVATLPDVVYSSRSRGERSQRDGVLLFVRTGAGHNVLAYVDAESKASVTESQSEILAAAACAPDEPARERDARHHELVTESVRRIVREAHLAGGSLGPKRGARYRVYTRLKRWLSVARTELPLFDVPSLRRALDDVYRHPLREAATAALNRHLRAGMDDADLAGLVIGMWEQNTLSIQDEGEAEPGEPRIICSMGMFGDRET